jgi:hypothetical protein
MTFVLLGLRTRLLELDQVERWYCITVFSRGYLKITPAGSRDVLQYTIVYYRHARLIAVLPAGSRDVL